MNGLVRKALLLKPVTRSASAKTNAAFIVLKCETDNSSTIFELSDSLKLNDIRYDIVASDGVNIIRFSPDDYRYVIKTPFRCENGFWGALFSQSDKKILMFGNSLHENVTISEVQNIYEKNRKNDNDAGVQQKEFVLSQKENSFADDYRTGKEEGETNLLSGASSDSAGISEYNDEALATENYYDVSEQNDYTEAQNDNLHSETVISETSEQDKREQTEDDRGSCKNAEDIDACAFEKRLPAFYAEKRDEIDALFEKYPSISSLSQYIPESRWVKIEYKKSGYYIVGTIAENDVVKYIVYGVPGTRDYRPRGFERYSVFLPETLFSPSGKGFWCAFQNAETGKVETLSD